MFRKEDFESWNTLFPECKINEADLSHPTEVFLTKALTCYLKALGYKADPPVEASENPKEKRQYLAKLAAQIDHIYKITHKTYSFRIIDLIRPTPKKTSHLLGILLNYLFYYNMYKAEIFEKVPRRINEEQKLKKSIADVEIENKELALKAQKCIEELERIKKDFPQIENELLKKKEILKDLQKEDEEYKRKILDMEDLKSDLESKIVPNEESQALEIKMEELQSAIDALKMQRDQNQSAFEGVRSKLCSIEQLCEEVSQAKSLIPPNLLEDLENSSISLQDAKKRLVEMQNEEERILLTKQKIEKTVEDCKAGFILDLSNLDNERAQKIADLERLERECKECPIILEDLEKRNNELEYTLHTQDKWKQYLIENANDLFYSYQYVSI